MVSEKLNIFLFSLKFLLLTVFLVVIFYTTTYGISINSLDLPLQSEGNLQFYTDICQFEGHDGKNRIEVYYSLDISQFITEESSKDNLVWFLKLSIITISGEKYADITERKAFAIDTSSKDYGAFVDMKVFEFSPDTVHFFLSISDSLNKKKGKIDKIIAFRSTSNELTISDPMFLSLIQKSQEDNIFTKHNLMMLPNPARLYDGTRENSNLKIYYEINNLFFDPEKPTAYAAYCTIEDLQGNEIERKDYPALAKSNANTSRIEQMQLSNLTPGIYRVNLRIVDMEEDASTSIWRYFRVYSSEGTANLILPMTEENVQKYYDQIKYIASEQEKSTFKQLDDRGKQEFLLEFWKSRDPDPATSENEFMEDHFKKIAYCEAHFKGGINSDMGRIYIQYGPPIDIERRASSIEYTKSYEVWTYAILGRVEFVFVDRNSDGKYVLVHSTHPDEYSNQNWMNDLK